jgi:hypothetical protein
MDDTPSFSPSHYFPQRRRAVQACWNCSRRKTKCDGLKPKCSPCIARDVDCIYRDMQESRIDPNTRILLERIQLLEDRLLSSRSLTAAAAGSPAALSAHQQTTPEPQPSQSGVGTENHEPGVLDVQISLSHTANANHVYNWPIIQQLLYQDSPAPAGRSSHGSRTHATDVFFEIGSSEDDLAPPPESWKLFSNDIIAESSQDPLSRCRELVRIYFSKVNVFYPILSMEDTQEVLENVAAQELSLGENEQQVSASSYVQLLLVLCLSSFVDAGESRMSLWGGEDRPGQASSQSDRMLHEQLWKKAKLLLGWVSADLTIGAAQCTLMAGFVGRKDLYSPQRLTL